MYVCEEENYFSSSCLEMKKTNFYVDLCFQLLFEFIIRDIEFVKSGFVEKLTRLLFSLFSSQSVVVE
jgi:hypothetical protein